MNDRTADVIRALGDNGKWEMSTIDYPFPAVDFSSWFYRNCKIQRRKKAKICQVCPFRKGIEMQERIRKSGGMA
jgi:hypothetical protein